MKKIALLISSVLVALLVLLLFRHNAGVAAVSSVTLTPKTIAAINAVIAKDRQLYGGRTPVPGVLVAVWDGTGRSYIHGFGFADVAKNRPLSSADHFRIGSNTKTFVVATILQLADEGKLQLDDPISRFTIGVTVPNGNHITIRELCEMRSGLFEAFDSPQFEKMHLTPQMKFNARTTIGWATKQKPYFAPGKAYKYSNTNYLILGLIIEAVTHDTVGNQIRKRLIGPFHLTHTSYPDTMAMPDPWARGYGLDKNRNWEDVSNTIPVSLMGAAGAMISDMTDMRQWIIDYVTGNVSKPATHRALMRCVPTGDGNLAFGLGLGCSEGWYGYTGGLPGYNTGDYYFPSKKIFILDWVDAQVNSPAPGVANAIFGDIAKIMTPNNAPFQAAKKGL